jgi:hypothetical protein
VPHPLDQPHPEKITKTRSDGGCQDRQKIKGSLVPANRVTEPFLHCKTVTAPSRAGSSTSRRRSHAAHSRPSLRRTNGRSNRHLVWSRKSSRNEAPTRVRIPLRSLSRDPVSSSGKSAYGGRSDRSNRRPEPRRPAAEQALRVNGLSRAGLDRRPSPPRALPITRRARSTPATEHCSALRVRYSRPPPAAADSGRPPHGRDRSCASPARPPRTWPAPADSGCGTDNRTEG